jgi:hypothetical protein
VQCHAACGQSPLNDPAFASANIGESHQSEPGILEAGCQSFAAVTYGFQKRPALAGRFFARLYCPSKATELFSMCSRMPGTIEPVFS